MANWQAKAALYDPVTKTATLDATVTSLVSSAGPDDGLLSAAAPMIGVARTSVVQGLKTLD